MEMMLSKRITLTSYTCPIKILITCIEWMLNGVKFKNAQFLKLFGVCRRHWQINLKATVLRMPKLCNVTKSRCREYFLASVLEKLVLAMHVSSQQMVVSLSPSLPLFPFLPSLLTPFWPSFLPSCLLVSFIALFSNVTSQIMPDSSDTSLEQTSCLQSGVSCLTCIHSIL